VPPRRSTPPGHSSLRELYEARHPKAVASSVGNQDRLLTSLDFPAEHRIHLRTTNPIESTFGTVKARTKQTRGAGSRAAGLAMAFKRIEPAKQWWRRVNALLVVAVVLRGIEFRDGERVKPIPVADGSSALEEVAA